VGTEAISFIFENHIFTFLCVETHLPIACPGCQKINVGLEKGGVISILDGGYDLCVVSEKLAVVVDVGWHVVDDRNYSFCSFLVS
jgi:hypothetical protein